LNGAFLNVRRNRVRGARCFGSPGFKALCVDLFSSLLTYDLDPIFSYSRLRGPEIVPAPPK